MTDEIKNKIPAWDKLYRTYTPTVLGTIMYNAHRKVLKRVVNDTLNAPKTVSILDIGCGKCSTLRSFREWGYVNSIGIDLALSGLEICECNGLMLGKDVFKMDATNTIWDDENFDIVFSEGILEHYLDFMPFVIEMARLSKKYIVIVQPNHFSLYGRLIQIGWRILRKDSGGVEELTYPLTAFYEAFDKQGFNHLLTVFTLLRENCVIVFERRTA